MSNTPEKNASVEKKSLSMSINDIALSAQSMRKKALKLALNAGKNGAHIGGGFSAMELLSTLFLGVMNYDPVNPTWNDRDRFFMSKGHGVLAYYTALWKAGILSEEELDHFEENGGDLPGHPVINPRWTIEASSGSLGMGIGIAAGSALAGKLNHKEYRCYVLLGDGECDEGTVWETAMAAAHYKLDNLIVLLDHNCIQSDDSCEKVMSLGDLEKKWIAFGWDVHRIDGHNVKAIYEVLSIPAKEGHPRIVIAETVKGKGVSFFENTSEWHHGIITQELYNKAMNELGGCDND